MNYLTRVILFLVVLSVTKHSFGFVDFQCINYLKDTVNHTYCVTYQDVSSGSPVNRYWDFGNGQYSSSPSPTICFSYPGLYSVKLIIENPIGVFDSISKYLKTDTDVIICDYNVGIGSNEESHSLLSIQITSYSAFIEFGKIEKEVSVNIYTLSGQLVSFNSFYKSENASIPFASHSTGIFIMSIIFDNAIINKKILIQNN